MPRTSVPVTPVTTPRSPHDTPPPSPTTHFDLQSQLNAQLAGAVAASQWPQIIDLVHRGAHLTADPGTGWTAAHGAAASGELRAIEAPLAAGMHPNEVMAQDARGQTLVGVCEPSARVALRCLLREYPARPPAASRRPLQLRCAAADLRARPMAPMLQPSSL